MVDFVASTRHNVITGAPLIFTRAGGPATTVIGNFNTWTALLPAVAPGELLPRNLDAAGGLLVPAPDFTFSNMDLATHLVRPQWPTGPWRMPVTCHLTSNAFGGPGIPLAGSRTYRVALWDVRNRVANNNTAVPQPAPGQQQAELLWSETFTGVDRDAAEDTLTLTMTAWPRRDASMRIYVRCDDRDAADVDDLDLLTDIRQLYIRVPIGA